MPRRFLTLFDYPGSASHFPGVAAALRERGCGVQTEAATGGTPIHEAHVQPWVYGRSTGVVVPDTMSTLHAAVLRMARRHGRPVALLMDGVVEAANTFINPHNDDAFLRPAPVDLICCGGRLDEGLLRALGNERVVATGLPRLVACEAIGRHADAVHTGPVIVATARTHAFNAIDAARVERALVLVRDALAARGVPAVWRVPARVAAALGVEVDGRPLHESLSCARAVLTTASTVLVEAMLAGVPTGLMHPHPRPCWQAAAWRWTPSFDEPSDHDRVVIERGAEATATAERIAGEALAGWSAEIAATGPVAGARELVERVLEPEAAGMDAQTRCLALLHTPDAAGNVARAIDEELHGVRSRSRVRVPGVSRMPAPIGPPRDGVRRVVSCNVCDGSIVGGVATWSIRLGRALRERPELGYEFHTLLIATEPMGYGRALVETDPDDPNQHLCVIDPTADPHVSLAQVREAIEGLHPDVVLPNYADMTWAAAMQLRAHGVRTVAVAHNDNVYFRDQIGLYDRWDAGVAVSSRCEDWLRPIAGERAVERITYGVPIAETPRRSGLASDERTTLEIAYVGRMIEAQKRVSLLPGLVASIDRAFAGEGLSYRFHMVGDGPDLASLRAAVSGLDLGRGEVIFHGGLDASGVERLMPTIDVSVLVSDHEGTSISMLEAMGASVVPCVTAVDSGVADWVHDGENGVVVPVDDVHAMAPRLAALARNPERLDAMGRAAWDRVRHELSTEAMAERYARVFDGVFERPMYRAGEPTDLGVRLSDVWRWNKTAIEDGAGAVDACAHWLSEAGYEAVAFEAPMSDCDAVLTTDAARPKLSEAIESWRGRGLGVASAPGLKPHPVLERAAAVLDDFDTAPESIAIYGAGAQARLLAGLKARGVAIRGFIDDNARGGARCMGLPVLTQEAAVEAWSPDAVLLSSWHHEQAMWLRSEGLRARGVPIVPMYRSVDELRSLEGAWRDAVVRVTARGRVYALGGASGAPGFFALLPAGVEIVPIASGEGLSSASVGAEDVCVVADPLREHELFARTRAARTRGVRVFGLAYTEAELTAPERAAAAVAARDGARVAIYGTGLHTQRLLELSPTPIEPVGFIEDRPGAKAWRGLPVVRPGEALEALRPDVVLLSSRNWEPTFWERTKALREAGVEVLALYHTASALGGVVSAA